jgi:DNA repair protein RadD
MNSFLEDWDHQIDAVAAIEKAWADGIRSVCYQCPTGGGKSRVLRRIVENHHAAKNVIYMIAHRRNLVSQLSAEIEEAEIKHGIIAAGNPYIRYRVQVASLQTLIRRADKLPEPEIIAIDEGHHCKSKSYMELIKKWSNTKILLLTATPRRTDGSPLSDVVQKLILGPPMRELIDNGVLSDYLYYAPEEIEAPTHKVAGDYNVHEDAQIMDKKVIIGHAVDHYRKYCDHLKLIASCTNIHHAEDTAQTFRDAGYRAQAIHSRLDDIKIRNLLNDFKNGELEILSQVDLLGEGIDIPGATGLMWLRHTASIVVYMQGNGRVLRKCKGKEHAIIIDPCNNWTRFGLPDDPRKWTLEGSTERETDTLPYKRCPNPECFRPVKISVKVCPYCGYRWGQDTETKLPQEIEGELRQIKGREAQTNLQRAIESNGCMTLKDAIRVARSMGQTHRQAWFVWAKILNRAY